MNVFKLLALTSMLVCGAANAGTLQATEHPASVPSNGYVVQCDPVSFATGSAQNRATCRREFAREARPNVQTSPLTASDYAS
ncbi:hypothetical protein G3N95_26800 [Paraburkholderia sp. Tr-20389]|uniref:hypothetical protein n=1 Tax=Paraburkholderia sp. Tr-20389 TaxID=2703903 RepID=UPI00197FCF8B|nr:hypothetical protein [Paraburkholderia sp. Tr-20389]MBN3756572.1 hypothetical protein [Paraburkholderia sp. Tr-20389]